MNKKRVEQGALAAPNKEGVQEERRIVVREIDVMEVHMAAGRKVWENFKDQAVNLTAGFHGMRGIDEQKVTGGNREVFQISRFRRFRDQLDLMRLCEPLQIGGRIGIDT